MVIAPESLVSLSALELREMVTGLMAKIGERDCQITQRDAQIVQRDETLASKDREIKYRQSKIDQLTHEMAVLKRWKFSRSREYLDSTQASLLDETIDADIAATGRRRIPPAAQTRSAAARAAPCGPAPRTRLHYLHHRRLRLHLKAHRRGRQ